MTSKETPELVSTLGVTRRGFLRTSAAGAGAAAAATYGLSSVDEAEAIAPAIVAGYGALAVSSIAVGYLLGEWDPLESETPPDGLGPDATQNQLYQIARGRESTDNSTIVDNRNLASFVSDTGYTDAKLAAIEKLNEGASQQEVQDAATAEVDSYRTTLESNLIESWNETVRQLRTIASTVEDHSDLDMRDDIVRNATIGAETTDDGHRTDMWEFHSIEQSTSYELASGETMAIEGMVHSGRYHTSSSSSYHESTIYLTEVDGRPRYKQEKLHVPVHNTDGDVAELLQWTAWNGVFTDIQTALSKVRDGVILWVDKVYSEVQSGSISIEDLITPRERAEMMSEDEEYPQAVADLLALNVPLDLEREATITIPSKGATMVGTVGVTDPSTPMNAGETYSPADFGTVFFTYDLSKGSGDWSAYQSGVDGGTATFTSEPHPSSRFHIKTAAGETVTVKTADFSANGDGTWSVGLSDQLENPITEIESVEFTADVDGTEYATVPIKDDFTVESFKDSDGNSHDSASFEQSEPQDDSNYITQEEWDAMQEKNEELINKYIEAKEEAESGGSTGGVTAPDFNLGEISSRTYAIVGGVLIGLAALARGGGGDRK